MPRSNGSRSRTPSPCPAPPAPPSPSDPGPSPAPVDRTVLRAVLSDRTFLASLRHQAAKLVARSGVDDVVQNCVVAALEAPHVPSITPVCQAWMRALVRHKAADMHRAVRLDLDAMDVDAVPTEPLPPSVRQKLRWVEQEVAEGHIDPEVIDHMVRRADGESLSAIGQGDRSRAREYLRYHRRRLRARWLEAEGEGQPMSDRDPDGEASPDDMEA